MTFLKRHSIFTIFLLSFLQFFFFNNFVSSNQDKGFREIKGKVVKYNSDKGIDGIKVEIRYEKEDEVEKDDITDNVGHYSIKLPKKIDKFWITYRPDPNRKDKQNYSVDGRPYKVRITANPQTLDTIGLSNSKISCGDGPALENALNGSIRYQVVTGDNNIADAFAKRLREQKCKIDFMPLDNAIDKALKSSRLRYWIKAIEHLNLRETGTSGNRDVRK